MKPEMDQRQRQAVNLSRLALAVYYIVLIALTVCIIFVLFVRMSLFTVVLGSSMEPTLHNYQIVFGLPDAQIQRGDIVTAYAPGDDAQRVIKRVVGIPGDVIFISSDGITINGVALYEGYLTLDAARYTCPENKKISVTLGEGEYYLLGDNRMVSRDSRAYGPVSVERIVCVQSTTPDAAFYLKALFLVAWLAIVIKFSIPLENRIRYKVRHLVLRDVVLADAAEEPAQTMSGEIITDES